MAVTLFVNSVIPVGAITLYSTNGYIYTLDTNDGLAALYSVEPEVRDLNVPRSLDGNLIGSIYDYAFYKNKDIVSLNLNNAVFLKSIGEMAFANTNIKDVTIPYWVGNVTFADFQDCLLLESIILKANIQTVPAQFCNRCSSLSTVEIPESVTAIEKFAFANCPSLTYMELSPYITSIALSAFQNDENLTLGVWYGSYGYEYAKEHNIPYILLDSVLLGDANGDGSVNINDVTTIQRHLAEMETLEEICLHAADANQDGTVDIEDATTIQMYLAEYEMDYPIGEIMTQ